MRAMILAAGRGERLRPLTDTCPKPLIRVGGQPLLYWHLIKLKAAGITEVIVNSAHLSKMIVDYLEDGSKFSMHIEHSVEREGGLETAGGIIKALPFFEDEPFLVLNGDTYIDGDYAQFLTNEPPENGAFLYLTHNPQHNLRGDFSLGSDADVEKGGEYTFTGAALYSPKAFCGESVAKKPLRPFFDRWIALKALKGTLLEGAWFDAGTTERLQIIEDYIRDHKNI